MAVRHDDTRNRLLEAAGEVFAEKGFRAATVREICARAGANVAAVSYYFGDKMGLYVAAVGLAHQGPNQRPLPNWPAGTPPAKKLHDFVTYLLANLQDASPSWTRRLLLREMAEPTEACAAVIHEYMRPRAELLDQILSDLLPAGTPAVERRLIAASIVGQCLFHQFHWQVMRLLAGEEARDWEGQQVADHVTRFSLAALGYAPPWTTPSGCRGGLRVHGESGHQGVATAGATKECQSGSADDDLRRSVRREAVKP